MPVLEYGRAVEPQRRTRMRGSAMFTWGSVAIAALAAMLAMFDIVTGSSFGADGPLLVPGCVGAIAVFWLFVGVCAPRED